MRSGAAGGRVTGYLTCTRGSRVSILTMRTSALKIVTVYRGGGRALCTTALARRSGSRGACRTRPRARGSSAVNGDGQAGIRHEGGDQHTSTPAEYAAFFFFKQKTAYEIGQ